MMFFSILFIVIMTGAMCLSATIADVFGPVWTDNAAAVCLSYVHPFSIFFTTRPPVQWWSGGLKTVKWEFV